MARRTSRNKRRRRSRRSSRRRRSRRRSSRRNPKYVVANKRRRSSRRRRRRRVRRNQFLGVDWMRQVVTPVLGAAAGFVGARYLGNMAAMKGWGTSDPKLAKTATALVGIPAVAALSPRSTLIARNSGALMLGMGMAAAESWIRDTPLLGGSPAAAAVMEDIAPAPSAAAAEGSLSSYYDYPTNAEGQALSDDYYTAGMLGNTGDPADQSAVEGSLDAMESVSTVIPTDLAMRAKSMPQFAPVAERFASGDRGHAGGLFSRNLFSGMMGS